MLDSLGIGAMPDAVAYGDIGSDTLASVALCGAQLPNLEQLGLGCIDGVEVLAKTHKPTAAHARMTEQSGGKDTTIGHWEIAGVISKEPMPTYPNGFPAELLEELAARTGRKILCNKPYSGTEVIKDYGQEQLETGGIILYTSADSVAQIAAHEESIPLPELYRICEIAREVFAGEHAVGRVIARPFAGKHPNFSRTANRHDYSLLPPAKTMLDYIKESGKEVISVGKIKDVFAGSGITRAVKTGNNAEGMRETLSLLDSDFEGLAFVNLVDFDMLFGHRNDCEGYAKALEEFDRWLPKAMAKLQEKDLLLLTADHGCDPATVSTDHSREYTPMLAIGKQIIPVNLGTRESFADIAATVLELLGVAGQTDGESFAQKIVR